jgi:hypothetical protein
MMATGAPSRPASTFEDALEHPRDASYPEGRAAGFRER